MEQKNSGVLIEDEKDIAEEFRTCEFNIDKNYEYVKKDFLFNFFSTILYYGIAIPILSVLIKFIYGLKIEGKENLDKVKSGAVSVSNHVLILDCAMVGIAFRKKKIYYTTQEESFKIPFVRKLIKLLRAIPIPKKIENKRQFIHEVDILLRNGNIVHFYPEAILKAYYENIRNFKNGAFNIAVKNNVPIIPVVICFRKPTKIRKILKKKKDVTLKILEPVESVGKTEIELKDIVKSKMEEAII